MASRHHIKFTIYVDDVTLSSANDFKHLVPEFMMILKRSGFKISHDKTFYKTKNPIVTGVVVHNNNLKRQPAYNKIVARLEKDDNAIKSLIGVKAYLQRIDNA